MNPEPTSTRQLQNIEYKFQLDIDIKKRDQRPLFQSDGKIIHEVQWINPRDQSTVLLEINGPTADQEASVYIRLNNHPNIIQTFGRVRNPLNLIMLLQERSPKADLSEMLRENDFKPTEKVLCQIFKQICDAMMFLVDHDIVHGDLACRNILVFQSNATEPTKNLVKLTDFGLARDLAIDNLSCSLMPIIPVLYAAPEILQNLDILNYSEKSDVYSMGVLMWEACSHGKIPYEPINDENEIRQRKLNGEKLPQPSLCSNQLWDTINRCWDKNPKSRPNFKTIKDLLSNLDLQSTSQSDGQSVMNVTLRSSFTCLPPIARNNFSTDNSHGLSPIHQSRFNRTPSQARSDSDNRLIIANNDTTESPSEGDDSQQNYTSDQRPGSYNPPSRKNQPIQCQCCQEVLSSEALYDHTENNCDNVDEKDPTLSRTDNRFTNPPSRDSSRESSRVNTIDTNTQENYVRQNTSEFPRRINVRIETTVLNQRVSSITRESEYCHNKYAQTDYVMQQDNSRQNPRYIHNRHQHRSVINEDNVLCTPVYIPCEVCKRPIEGSNYSIHTQVCQEQDKRRMEQRAQIMSQQPVAEPIPCEYCNTMYAGNELSSHQANCQQNSLHTATTVNPVPQRYSPPLPRPSTVSPISRSQSQSSELVLERTTRFQEPVNKINDVLQRPISIQNVRSDTYISIDHDRNDLANRLFNDDQINRDATVHQYCGPRITSSTPPFESRHISRADCVYENVTVFSGEHHSYSKRTMIHQSRSTIELDTQESGFRPMPMGTESFNNHRPDRAYSSESVQNTRQNRNSDSDDFAYRLPLNDIIGCNGVPRKKKYSRSRQHRSGQRRTNKQEDRHLGPFWEDN